VPLWEELGGEAETLHIYYAVVHRHVNHHLHNTASAITDSFRRANRTDLGDADIDVPLRAAFFSMKAWRISPFVS
jgi:hypothetical protein